jgi:hypothetical protein
MTGEQFLNSIRYLDMEINALDVERCKVVDQRQALLEQAEHFGAALSGVSVKHGVSSKTESLGVQLADLMAPEAVVRKLNSYQQRINHKIDRLVDKKQKALDVIERMPNSFDRALIIYRYLCNKQWADVADPMGFCENWVKNDLKVQALAAFEEAWKSTT